MKKFIAAILILIFVSGCEQIIENPKWPQYKEKLVITAWLVQNNPDSLEITCAVRRTLPLSEKFDTTKIKVSNAVVTLSSGEFNQTLQPQNDPSVYTSKYSNPKKSDYRLTVKWNGLTAFSDITMEVRNRIIDSSYFQFVSAQYMRYNYNFFIQFDPIPNGFKHEIRWSYRNSDLFYSNVDDYTSQTSNNPPKYPRSNSYTTLADGKICGKFEIHFEDTTAVKAFIHLTVFSPSHEDYENVQYWYGGSGGLFEDSPNGLNPKFNVMGDGIGFFWYEYHERKEVRY